MDIFLMEVRKMSDECKHEWYLFRDGDVKGFLTFFCKRCLELRKVKKEYKGDDKDGK